MNYYYISIYYYLSIQLNKLQLKQMFVEVSLSFNVPPLFPALYTW